MDRDSFEAFAMLMQTMSEVFGEELSEQKMEIYFRFLEDLSLEQIRKAVAYILQRRVYKSFPTIAEIRQAIEAEEDEAIKTRAELAWDNVLRQIVEVGFYGTPKLDPIAQACVKALGGWACLCDMPRKELAWIGKDFVAMYQRFAKYRQALPRSDQGDMPRLGAKPLGELITNLKEG